MARSEGSLNFLGNGDLIMCRFDWKRSVLLGNDLDLNKTPKKVWNSIHLWQLQQMFLRSERVSSVRFCRGGVCHKVLQAKLDIITFK
jgi:hypothetical protein